MCLKQCNRVDALASLSKVLCGFMMVKKIFKILKLISILSLIVVASGNFSVTLA